MLRGSAAAGNEEHGRERKEARFSVHLKASRLDWNADN
jgi:hypothetical protein